MDTFVPDQVGNDLLLKSGLADLTWTAENGNRSKATVEFAECRVEDPPMVGGHERSWLALPPGVRASEKLLQRGGESLLVKDIPERRLYVGSQYRGLLG